MILNFVLLATVGTLIATGVYLFLDRSLTRMLMGLLLMGNGINLLILLGSGSPGQPPIWDRESLVSDAQADSLPQAFILTAIVISMGMTAFLCKMTTRTAAWQCVGPATHQLLRITTNPTTPPPVDPQRPAIASVRPVSKSP